MIGLGKYTTLSAVASGAVVYHAFATREQFYPSMQYLTSSKLSIAVMGNLGFAMALCLYRVLTKLFLGTLREAEVERINERISQAVMETCLAMTIFREEFNVSFVAMFATLTFVKVFHWLVQDRVDYIETTPSVSVTQHVKIVSFMGLLLMVDSLFLQYTISETLQRGPSVLLLFAFEYVIQASMIVSTFLKYGFIGIDMMLEGRWENKGVYVFYLELITDMLHLFVYLMFFIIVFTFYGLPLHLVRDLYWTFRNFRQRVADFLRYRRVTANMNERFPDATPEDLARCDGTCIICREEMTPSTQNKKLPCGHVFHLTCLRSWLERQQNCPTCRANVLQVSPRADTPAGAEQGAAAAPVQAEDAVRGPAQGGAVAGAAERPAEPARRAPHAGAAGPSPPPASAANQPAAASPVGLQRHQDAAPRPSQGTVRRRHSPTDSAPGASPSSPGGERQPSTGADRSQHPGQYGNQPQPQRWHFYSAPMYSQWEWSASAPMGMFPGMMPMQYAGQQAPVPPEAEGGAPHRSMPAYMLPRMSVPMVPVSMLLPPSAVAVPASSNATHEQHRAAAAAAAAATAALMNPWGSGLSLMPPTMLTQQQAADAAQAQAAAQQASAQAAAATAAAVASAAAAAALISSSSQAPSTAAQVLQSHINFLQSHMEHLGESSSRTSAASAATAADSAAAVAPHGKGKEKLGQVSTPGESSQSSAIHTGSTDAGQAAYDGSVAATDSEIKDSEPGREADKEEDAEGEENVAAQLRNLRLQRFQ